MHMGPYDICSYNMLPTEICKLIFNYYEGLFGKVVTKDWSSSWFIFEIGLFQGCTATTFRHCYCLSRRCGIEANFRVPPLVYADDVEFLTSTTGQNSTCLNLFKLLLNGPKQCKRIHLNAVLWHLSCSRTKNQFQKCFLCTLVLSLSFRSQIKRFLFLEMTTHHVTNTWGDGYSMI
jgi:hypothetical protein